VGWGVCGGGGGGGGGGVPMDRASPSNAAINCLVVCASTLNPQPRTPNPGSQTLSHEPRAPKTLEAQKKQLCAEEAEDHHRSHIYSHRSQGVRVLTNRAGRAVGKPHDAPRLPHTHVMCMPASLTHPTSKNPTERHSTSPQPHPSPPAPRPPPLPRSPPPSTRDALTADATRTTLAAGASRSVGTGPVAFSGSSR